MADDKTYVMLASKQMDAIEDNMRAVRDLIRLQVISNVALSVMIAVGIGFCAYLFMLGDANNYLSRLTFAVERLAGTV